MINFEKKIVFTHPPKCGGTSIEYALDGLPKDYIEKHDQEILEKGDSLGSLDLSSNVQYKHNSLTFHINKLLEQKEDLKEYFIFSCVRNPWDRAVSRYYYDTTIVVNNYRRNNPGKPLPLFYQHLIGTFDQYITTKYHTFKHNKEILEENSKNILAIKSFIFHEEKNITNYVIRFENIQQDYKFVAEKIKLPNKCLKHIYFHNKRPKKNYQDYYTSLDTKSMVEEMGQDTIELFGYTF